METNKCNGKKTIALMRAPDRLLQIPYTSSSSSGAVFLKKVSSVAPDLEPVSRDLRISVAAECQKGSRNGCNPSLS